MATLSLRRPLLLMVSVLVLTLALTLLQLTHGHGVACAHDLSGLCLDPRDQADKDTYVYDASQRPGKPGARPAVSPDAGRTNVRLIGSADPGGGFNADVVAHRDFAYLASWGTSSGERAGPGLTLDDTCPSQGVRVYDLSDPSDPQHVATFADAGIRSAPGSEPDLYGSWTEKVIVRRGHTRHFKGDLAAVSFQSCRGAEGFRGFGVYDVTDPTDPRRMAVVRTDDRANGSHEIWLDPRDGKAYVYTAIILNELRTSPDGVTPGEPDFLVYDVSRPQQPRKVGGWGAWAELGEPPVSTDANGTTRVNFVHSVISRRDTVYLSYWDLGTVTLDLADPTAPRFLGRTTFSAHEEGNAHSAWTARGGRLLAQTDEDFNPAPSGALEQAWGYTRLFDNSDPANPKRLGTFEMPTTRQYPPPGPGFFTVHDPKFRGNRLYLSYYAEGVVVLDTSDPRNPSKLAQFKPPATPDPRGTVFFGGDEPIVNVWGVFLHRNYALASDINSGLYVFQVTGKGRG